MAHPPECASVWTAASPRFDAAIELLMVGLVALLPLGLGVWDAWSEPVAVGVAGAMALCLTAKLSIDRGVRLVWCWPCVPVALFLLLVVAQLVPLPSEMVRVISPTSEALKRQLLSDLPDSAKTLQTIEPSLYPLATERGLQLLVVPVVAFLVTVNVYRRPDRIRRLLWAVTCVGAAVAVIALLRTWVAGRGNYPILNVMGNLAGSGGFLARVRCSQYLNLSMGAGLGLLFVKLREVSARRDLRWGGAGGRAAASGSLHPARFVLPVLILSAAAVFSLRTRAGMVALLVGVSFTGLIACIKFIRKRRSWVFILLTVTILTCGAGVGFHALSGRMASPDAPHDTGLWSSFGGWVIPVRSLSPIGTGLGTHEVTCSITPTFTLSEDASAAHHYAQLANETGVIGLALTLCFLIMVWFSYARVVRRTRLPHHFAAIGLGFGLLATMIHGFGGPGQLSFPVICLSGIFAGLVVNFARTGQVRGGGGGGAVRAGFTRTLRILATLTVIMIAGWSLVGSVRTACARAHWRRAREISEKLRGEGWNCPPADYTELLSHASIAAGFQPGNVEYRTMSSVWRWRSVGKTDDAHLDKLVRDSRITSSARATVTELEKARALCPTYGPAYCAAGLVETFILGLPIGTEHIRTGYALGPRDVSVCFVTGMLDAREGRFYDSLEKLRGSLQLDKNLIGEVTDVYIRQVKRPDLAVAVAGGNIGWLMHVANALSELDEHRDFAAEARRQVLSLLKAKCQRPGAPAWAFACVGKLYLRDRRYGPAIEYFRRALELDYAHVHWRMNLARALVEVGRISEGLHEARVCLRFRGEMGSARKLLTEFSVPPDSSNRE